jgi:hypothetical protein
MKSGMTQMKSGMTQMKSEVADMKANMGVVYGDVESLHRFDSRRSEVLESVSFVLNFSSVSGPYFMTGTLVFLDNHFVTVSAAHANFSGVRGFCFDESVVHLLTSCARFVHIH